MSTDEKPFVIEDDFVEYSADAEVLTSEILKKAKKAGIGDVVKNVLHSAEGGASRVRTLVKSHPYETIAAVTAVGVILGLLLGYRRNR